MTESSFEPDLGEPDDQELFTTRVVAADPDAIFAAFSDAARLARWWGPSGFTNTFTQFDFRPGGQWHYTMHGPHGANFVNTTEFVDLVPGRRFVIDHISSPEFRLTVTLSPEDGGTLVTWRQRFPTPDDCRKIAQIAVGANEENLDRLEVEVARGTGSGA